MADRAVKLRVLALPGAKDPDDLIRADPTAWPALVRSAVSVIDFVLHRVEARHDLGTAQQQAGHRSIQTTARYDLRGLRPGLTNDLY